MPKTDFYAVLEITKTATTDEIKKAYKKLAIKWHPDKNPGREKEAEERFKIIAEAYAILSHPEKRKNYDTYGTADGSGMRGGPSFNPNDFEFGGFKGFGRAFSSDDDFFAGGFTFERAEEMFREAFGDEDFGFGSRTRNSKPKSHTYTDPRSQRGFPSDDFFGDMGMGMGMGMGMSKMMKNFGFGADPFFQDDGFGFGGMGMGMGMGSMMSNMSSMMNSGGGGGFGGQGKSVSTSTIIRNGKKVTVTKTTIRNPDGTSHTEVHENIQDDGKTLKDERYIDNSANSRLDFNRSNSNSNNNGKAIGYGNSGQSRKSKY